MRALLTMASVAAAVAATLATAASGKAQTGANPIPYYPWCAIETGSREGGERRSCGFISYAQCMESVRGQTGICFENVWAANPGSGVRSDERPQRKR